MPFKIAIAKKNIPENVFLMFFEALFKTFIGRESIIMLQLIDNALLNFIQAHARSPIMDQLMPAITRLGDGGAIWIAIALFFLCTKKYRAAGAGVLLALLLSELTGNIILKPLIARLRPCQINNIALLIPCPTGFSFPSGHTITSMAAASAIFLRSKRLGVFSLILAVFIAFSRLYLYVHYPTDILGGIVIGVPIGMLAAYAIHSLFKTENG